MSGWLDLASVADTSRQLKLVPGADTSGQLDLASEPMSEVDMSGWLNVATRADTSGWLDLASVADVWTVRLGGQSRYIWTTCPLKPIRPDSLTWPPDLMCGRLDLAPRADTCGWLDLDSS